MSGSVKAWLKGRLQLGLEFPTDSDLPTHT